MDSRHFPLSYRAGERNKRLTSCVFLQKVCECSESNTSLGDSASELNYSLGQIAKQQAPSEGQPPITQHKASSHNPQIPVASGIQQGLKLILPGVK